METNSEIIKRYDELICLKASKQSLSEIEADITSQKELCRNLQV
jgi:hypothetical protein